MIETRLTIKQLYSLALAEEEGVGTAYEYFAKRLVLRRWMDSGSERPATVLIAGLPERYGSSLDFMLLAGELSAQLIVIDDRQSALERWQAACRRYEELAFPKPRSAEAVLLTNLDDVSQFAVRADLTLSSEVLQRLAVATRATYLKSIVTGQGRAALFCPNRDNDAHVGISGLNGLTLQELKALIHEYVPLQTFGYIDMPPFPPGITRSEEQRERASSGTAEAIAMRGLELYARCERLMPRFVRRSRSHIVYSFFDRDTNA